MAKYSYQQNGSALTTKLNPPFLRPDITARPQLLELLESAVQRPLTLVSAPAGYGKSTLVAQWLHTSSLPGVWVSLDAGDNKLHSFLRYIVSAVRRLHEGACPGIYELLEVAQLPPVETLTRLLANDLESIDRPFLLVLDDYHVVSEPAVHELLFRLLQHPPRSLHLVVVSRRDPPLPIATMRARGQAVEIREHHLQFSVEETRQVLASIADIHLDEDAMAMAMEEIEGWITGLRLFCLALGKNDSPKAYLAGMRGGDRNVQDYLIEQVLSLQTPELQECLLKTSILDRFCAPLCEALWTVSLKEQAKTPAISGETFLATITESRLFGIQLESGNKWIRYHHLFQHILRDILQRSRDPQEIAALHGRAAQWLSKHGLTEEAIQHALAAGDTELAADLIEQGRIELINTDCWARMAQWLDNLPAGMENTRPHLLMCRVYLLLNSVSNYAAIPALLDKVVPLQGQSPTAPMLAGELHLFQGLITVRSGALEAASCHFRAALEVLPEENREARSLSALYQYVVQHMQGQGKLAREDLRRAIHKHRSTDLHYHSRLIYGLSHINSLAGQWPQSLQAAQQLMELTRPHKLSFAASWAAYLAGRASLQMLDLDSAEQWLGQAYKLRYLTNAQAAIDGIVGYVICLHLQGKATEADAVLHDAQDFATWTGDPEKTDTIDSARARIALLRGDVDSASRWLSASSCRRSLIVKRCFLEYPDITACRVLVARGTPDDLAQAAPLVASLEHESRRFHNVSQLVPALVLKSQLESQMGRIAQALKILSEAVDLAWPGRWLLPFVEGGAAVAERLKQLPENPQWGGFVPEVLRYHTSSARPELTSPTVPQSGELLVDPLTFREMDVLTLLCERLRDKEISSQLSISTGTVKTHLNHIYTKLSVSGRREAVQKAQQLGLA